MVVKGVYQGKTTVSQYLGIIYSANRLDWVTETQAPKLDLIVTNGKTGHTGARIINNAAALNVEFVTESWVALAANGATIKFRPIAERI